MFGIYEFFEINARLYPHKTALVKGPTRLTYGELSSSVNALSHALFLLGCQAGDRVGFMFRNGPEFVITFYAIQKLGAVAVPFCFLLPWEELKEDLIRTQCAYFLYDQAYIPLVETVRKGLTSVRAYIHNGPDRRGDCHTFTGLLDRGSRNWDQVIPGHPEDEALLLFTSGSTGRSKCVIHSRQNLLFFLVLPLASDNAFVREDVMLYYAPLFHLAGITYLVYLMSLGGTLVLVERFDPEEVLGLLEQERVTELFLIPPTLVNRLEACPEARRADLSSVRYVIASGGANTPRLGEKIFGLFPKATLCNTYGHSERAANTILFLSREEFARNPGLLNSVGRATQFSELRLVDGQGRETDSGEAYARSPGMLRGYLDQASPFVDGWLPTGDILRRDENGYYFFLDRKKDMVKTGGENVYAPEVENVIRSHPAVSACAVVGLPDEIYGSAVAAAVVLQPGQSVTAEELVELCRQRLAPYKKPRRVFFLDRLPTSAVGKVQKAVLRQQLEEREKN